MARPLVKWSLRIALLGGVLVAGLLGWVIAQMPGRGADRIEVSPEVTGVWAQQSYVWILRTPHGAVLVDAGGEPDAETVTRELEAMGRTADQVQAILVTHGHKDHWTGAAHFQNAQVYVGPGETAVLTEEHKLTSPAGRLTRLVFPKPAMPQRVREVKDGEELSIDTLSFRALHLPGHTPGSTMYLLGDLLFTGDTLLSYGDRLDGPPSFLSESDAQLRESLNKLEALQFTRIADGHTGLASK